MNEKLDSMAKLLATALARRWVRERLAEQASPQSSRENANIGPASMPGQDNPVPAEVNAAQ